MKADKTLETENNNGHDDLVEVDTLRTMMTSVILIDFSYGFIYVNQSMRPHLFNNKRIINIDKFYLDNSNIMRCKFFKYFYYHYTNICI